MRRKSGLLARVVNQVVQLVNGRCLVPLSMSWVDMCLTTDSWVSFVNAQTWQASSSHGAALRLEKCEGSIAEPDTCRTETQYWLSDRNVDTWGLAETLLGNVFRMPGCMVCCRSVCRPCEETVRCKG